MEEEEKRFLILSQEKIKKPFKLTGAGGRERDREQERETNRVRSRKQRGMKDERKHLTSRATPIATSYLS